MKPYPLLTLLVCGIILGFAYCVVQLREVRGEIAMMKEWNDAVWGVLVRFSNEGGGE